MDPVHVPYFHFHIRWSGKATLDWEGFRTREEGESKCKKQLMRLGETYTIEDFDGDFPRCLDAWNLKSSQGNESA
jgi:hypothetical protein